jgi:3-hydroxyanthranilate 3,4-dioxygenase
MSTLPLKFNFMQWIDSNRHLLKPPVANKVIWSDQAFICMVVGGPNQRTDYHIEDGPEFFYQIEGELTLKLQLPEGPSDLKIEPGEIFLLPPRLPHSPQRAPNSIGLVIERQRLAHEQDGLRWYCERCNHALYEEFFHLSNIETQFGAVFDRFYGSHDHRTCGACGHLNPAPARYG